MNKNISNKISIISVMYDKGLTREDKFHVLCDYAKYFEVTRDKLMNDISVQRSSNPFENEDLEKMINSYNDVTNNLLSLIPYMERLQDKKIYILDIIKC